MSVLTITCIQAEIVPGDPRENTRRAETLLEKCEIVEQGPHFVVFLELYGKIAGV